MTGDPVSARLRSDPLMSSLVDRYRPFPKEPQGLFPSLLRAVVSQQISNRSARTIHARLKENVGLSPENLSSAPHAKLQRHGVSPRKSACIKALAELEVQGDLRKVQELPDQEIRQELLKVHGVGPWTVDMGLIFGLHRPDIWPLTDHGLRVGAVQVYGIRPDRTTLTALGDVFRPYRSYAAWYLWRSLEN